MTKRELSAHLEQEISSALGYKDGKLTKAEKDAVMKEVIDVGKAVLKAKWGLF